MDELVKIRIPPTDPEDMAETVWAKPMGPDSFQLENIPFTGQWNEGDVVRCAMPAAGSDEHPMVEELLKRSPNRKLFVKFPMQEGSTTRMDADLADVAKELIQAAVAYEVVGAGGVATSLPTASGVYSDWVRRLRELEPRGVRVFIDEVEEPSGGTA